MDILLIDLSSIAHPIWHMSSAEPDPNATSQKIIARVRALSASHPAAAVCCDAGRSFRKDIAASYKANRPEQEAALHHQIRLAVEILEGDGFPVWSVPGFEADDLIASAVSKALALDDTTTVTVASADKDLLQLISPRVTGLLPRDGTQVDAEMVMEKFGVHPVQMRDYLTMVGDASDNVKGIKGIGPKRAAELLDKFGTLDDLYRDMTEIGPVTLGLTPAIVTALKEFKPQIETTRALITLRSDVEIPFNEVLQERVPREVALFSFDPEGDDTDMDPEPSTTDALSEDAALQSADPAPEPQQNAVSVRDVEVLTGPPTEWERQLDPRSMRDARVLAKDMYDSRMFSAYGTPQAVLATVMVGRELGLPAMSSLRNVHNIEGRHGLAASLMVAIVLKSGFADYFEPVSFSDTEATFETQRKGARKPVRLTHTIEMARTAWPKSKADWEKSFLASGWGRNPTDMLVARATSRLARMVYPDLLAGLYTPDELREISEDRKAA